MIAALLKLLVTIHAWWVAGTVFEFKIIPRSSLDRYVRSAPGYWDRAHHVVEGKNGGELLIPRTPVWFPEFLWKNWALIYKPRPRKR